MLVSKKDLKVRIYGQVMSQIVVSLGTAISPALLSDRLHRDPPQVKMTARINSRPQSFTPYDGSSMAWTPATSRHTASITAFHIVPCKIMCERSA